jgi:hypothetical protein
MMSHTDKFFFSFTIDLILPVALALVLVEHESIAASFRVVSGRLTLMEYVTIDRVRIVAIGLVLAEALLDTLPHVVLLAKTVHIHRPVALLLRCVVTQIVLTREYDVLAILTHVVSVTVQIVRVFAVWFVRAECYFVNVS